MYKSSLNTFFLKQFKIISCFFKLNLLLQLFFKYESCHEYSIYRMFWTFYKPDLTFFFHGPMNSVHSIKVFQQIHYYHNQHIWKAVSWLCDFSSSFWWNLVLHLLQLNVFPLHESRQIQFMIFRKSSVTNDTFERLFLLKNSFNV